MSTHVYNVNPGWHPNGTSAVRNPGFAGTGETARKRVLELDCDGESGLMAHALPDRSGKRYMTLRSERGFTLIESIIALAVLAVSLLGLAQLMAVALRQNAFARSNTMAITLAQEQLEDLRAKYNTELESGTAHADLTAGTHGPNTVTFTPPAGSVTGTYSFTVEWNVTIAGKQKTVQVTVGPVQQDELTSKTISVTTVFSP